MSQGKRIACWTLWVLLCISFTAMLVFMFKAAWVPYGPLNNDLLTSLNQSAALCLTAGVIFALGIFALVQSEKKSY